MHRALSLHPNKSSTRHTGISEMQHTLPEPLSLPDFGAAHQEKPATLSLHSQLHSRFSGIHKFCSSTINNHEHDEAACLTDCSLLPLFVSGRDGITFPLVQPILLVHLLRYVKLNSRLSSHNCSLFFSYFSKSHNTSPAFVRIFGFESQVWKCRLTKQPDVIHFGSEFIRIQPHGRSFT
jgi:hypothetical protein